MDEPTPARQPTAPDLIAAALAVCGIDLLVHLVQRTIDVASESGSPAGVLRLYLVCAAPLIVLGLGLVLFRKLMARLLSPADATLTLDARQLVRVGVVSIGVTLLVTAVQAPGFPRSWTSPDAWIPPSFLETHAQAVSQGLVGLVLILIAPRFEALIAPPSSTHLPQQEDR